MYLIEKSAGEAVQFVAVYVDGSIGHSKEEAESLAKEITLAVTAIRSITKNEKPSPYLQGLMKEKGYSFVNAIAGEYPQRGVFPKSNCECGSTSTINGICVVCNLKKL